MEEQEVPLENVHEHIEHAAHASEEKWVARVALGTAILAALAAITSLLAGDHANEAMIEQIKASDQWNFYQAKGLKAEILSVRLTLPGVTPTTADKAKLAAYSSQQAAIRKTAAEEQAAAQNHLARHVILARGVTLFQIAIAIAAISILTRRQMFWVVSLAFGAVGLFLLCWGLFLVRLT